MRSNSFSWTFEFVQQAKAIMRGEGFMEALSILGTDWA